MAFNPSLSTNIRNLTSVRRDPATSTVAAKPVAFDPRGLVPVNRTQPLATDGMEAQRMMERRLGSSPTSSFSGAGNAFVPAALPVTAAPVATQAVTLSDAPVGAGEMAATSFMADPNAPPEIMTMTGGEMLNADGQLRGVREMKTNALAEAGTTAVPPGNGQEGWRSLFQQRIADRLGGLSQSRVGQLRTILSERMAAAQARGDAAALNGLQGVLARLEGLPMANTDATANTQEQLRQRLAAAGITAYGGLIGA